MKPEEVHPSHNMRSFSDVPWGCWTCGLCDCHGSVGLRLPCDQEIMWIQEDDGKAKKVKPPETLEELNRLDLLHYSVGLGGLWMISKRRAQILRTIRMGGVVLRDVISGEPGPEENKKVPLVVYQDGERVVIGDAVLKPGPDGVEVSANVTAVPEAMKPVLQDFSIGFAPPKFSIQRKKRKERT